MVDPHSPITYNRSVRSKDYANVSYLQRELPVAHAVEMYNGSKVKWWGRHEVESSRCPKFLGP